VAKQQLPRVDTFSGINHYNENRRRCSLHRHGQSTARGQTVRAYRPDGPRVRRGGEGHRRRLNLTPGRDPIGEERS
jgi:hypothetical protein